MNVESSTTVGDVASALRKNVVEMYEGRIEFKEFTELQRLLWDAAEGRGRAFSNDVAREIARASKPKESKSTTDGIAAAPASKESIARAKRLKAAQAARVAAFLHLRPVYREIDRLDYESDPLNELLDGRSTPAVDEYQARLDAICRRERVLLRKLRRALLAFHAADIEVVCAGGHSTEDYADKDHFGKDFASDPLSAHNFDHEDDIGMQVRGYLQKLSEAYPEVK